MDKSCSAKFEAPFSPLSGEAETASPLSTSNSPLTLSSNGGGRITKSNPKKRRSIVEQSSSKLRSPISAISENPAYLESFLIGSDHPQVELNASKGSCCGGTEPAASALPQSQNSHDILGADSSPPFGHMVNNRILGGPSPLLTNSNGIHNIALNHSYSRPEYSNMMWRNPSEWKAPQPSSQPSQTGSCCGSKKSIDQNNGHPQLLPINNVSVTNGHGGIGHNGDFTGMPNQFPAAQSPDFDQPLLFDSNNFHYSLANSDAFLLQNQIHPNNGHFPDLKALNGHSNQNSLHGVADSQSCTCGPGCNCLGCAVHPYNNRTLEFIDSVRDLVDVQSPTSDGAETQVDTTNGEDHSMPSIQGSPSSNMELNPNAFVLIDYPAYAGTCYCEDGCQCISCWSCFDRNTRPLLGAHEPDTLQSTKTEKEF